MFAAQTKARGIDLKTIYQTLIWAGILIFITGVICDAKAIEYLRYGAIVGPILFGIGTIIWIPLRIKNPILHPMNFHEYKSTADAFLAFIFNNFMLEFWAFCCAFGMLMVTGGGAAMKSSGGFNAAVTTIMADDELTNRIGEFQGTGILVSGSTSSTKAHLIFSAYGTTGGTRVSISLAKESGQWLTTSLTYD
ncbi:hypothetical protein RT717_03880 [Imperialibacter roseus]|uniref:Uncharacterized protein n=1 Tax=Imperialibacter roseus TaxID=1324217 RepID=A0ABZ0ITL0_9BACT|nr:hypothetical protein [Imperialibacter roseus]WOK07763.1 hypothetical protein RT717_03880 [Imperialibacter roseus]